MSSKIVLNVPIIGTKVIESRFFVQFRMTKSNKEQLLQLLEIYKSLGYEYLDPIALSSVRYKKQLEELPDQLDILKKHIDSCNLCTLANSKGDFKKSIYSSTDILVLFPTQAYIKDSMSFNLLSNIMNNVLKYDVEQLYISYLVQCPITSTDDIVHCTNICKAYIIKEIEIIKPKIILMFGDTYNSFFDTNENILDISSSILKYKDSIVIPFVDLQFIIKNPSYKKKAFADLLKIKKVLDKI